MRVALIRSTQLKKQMIEVIGTFIGDMLGYLFIDVLCHGLGLTYLWIKNRGRKSIKQIRQETESLSEVGKTIIAKAFAGVMILLLTGLLLAVVVSVFKYGLQ